MKEGNGFSLLELVLALALGLIILGALANSFVAQRNAYDYQEQVMEMAQTARAIVDMISRELMMAGYNPTARLQKEDDTSSDYAGVVYHDPNLHLLEIRADIGNNGVSPDNPNGIIVTDDSPADPDDWKYERNERIVYWLDGDVLRRKVGGAGGSFQPFAENVKSFALQYLDGGSSSLPPLPTTQSKNVRQVKLSVEIEKEKAGINRGTGDTKAEAVVDLRNMGMTPHSGTTCVTVTTTTEMPPTTTTVTDTTTTTVTGTSTSTSVTATSSSSTTTTTYYDVPPDDDHLQELEGRCQGKYYYVSLDACLEGGEDKIKIRVYVAQNRGNKFSPYNDATVEWFTTGGPDGPDIDEEPDYRSLEFQYNGWYGVLYQAYCSCGSFSTYQYCDQSDYYVEGGGNPTVTLKITIPGCEDEPYIVPDIEVEIP